VHFKARTVFLTAVLWAAPVALHAQFDFNVDGRPVQIHSFLSQGFAYSNQNNYLTMKTSAGSFDFSDLGANVSMRVTDQFRVGAQFYTRNVGHLGEWEPTLDWAVADYKVKDWFGVRGGKVKTTLGLFNDTQDMEFLHTWALLPQSTYPLDTRGDTISHIGGDLYGNIAIKGAGTVAYTAYGGKRPDDLYGGYVYSLDTTQGGTQTTKLPTNRSVTSYGGPTYGADLRWVNPLKGLTAGASFLSADITTKGYFDANHAPYERDTLKDNMPAYYAEYTIGNFRFDAEYRKENKTTKGTAITGVWNTPTSYDIRMGYGSAAYRICKRLEVGTYYSRYYPNFATPFHSLPANHLFDHDVTARIDLASFLDLKIEGHFLDGNPVGNALRGFYSQDNPDGVLPTTRLLVLRLGYHM
jgi:hypothetical protein